MQDISPTLLSQYAQAPVINSIIDTFNGALDPSANIDLFYDDFFNIDTAIGNGLDRWGRILGISRVLDVATGNYFGMTGPAGASGQPYNQAPFYAGAPLTTNSALSDAAYRVLLLAKAAANICDGAIPSINAIMLMLFAGRGDAYVTSAGTKAMTYTFAFALSAVDYAIVLAFAGFLTPTGVAYTMVQP